MNIFEYENYREFLCDYYQRQKELNSPFSYRGFARRAGIRTANYLKKVIDGQRPVTERNIKNFIKGLNLKGDEAKYFKALVELERATTLEERERVLETIHAIRKGQLRSELEKEHYEIFSHWYSWAIRELVLLKDFKPTPEYIVKKLKYKISRAEAEEQFNLLVKHGYITKDNGSWRQSNPMITTSDGIVSPSLCKLHQEMLTLGIKSIFEDPIPDRSNSGLTIAVSRDKMSEIKKRISEFRRELNAFLTTDDNHADEVVQINIIAFKLTGGIS